MAPGPIKNDQPPMPYDYEQTLIPVAQTLKENPNPECHLKCPQNEYCLLLDNQPTCHCPQSISFFRINSQCREMYAAMPVCDETLICKPNEDCVTISIYAKEGTCQCSMGYRRDLTTFECKNGSGEDIVSSVFIYCINLCRNVNCFYFNLSSLKKEEDPLLMNNHIVVNTLIWIINNSLINPGRTENRS